MEIISKPNPVYTEEARQLKLQGEVLLEVLFGANGQLHVNRVVRGMGHGLDEAAVSAANKMRFKPAQHLQSADRFDCDRACGFPVGVLGSEQRGFSHAYLEMDDHRFPAARVQRDGAADDSTRIALAGRMRQRSRTRLHCRPRRSPRPARPRRRLRAAAAAPTTMDQVVDRAIVREHALITFLQTRTPLVETYLQNLKLDQQMGPVAQARTTTSSAAWT